MQDRNDPLQAFEPTQPFSQDSLPEVAANRIRTMISEGKLAPGSRLPNELELAERMGVSRGTIRAALHLLQQQGLVWRRQGVGTFVSDKPILENRLDINLGVTGLIESMGLVPGTKNLEVRVIPADEHVAQQLEIAVGSPVVSIRRVRTASERPVVSSVDLLALEKLQQGQRSLTLDALTQALQTEQSLYRVLEKHLHIVIESGIARLRPIITDEHLMKQLSMDVPTGSVMLYLEQLDFDRDRRPVVLAYEYHIADFSTFTVYRRR